MTTGEHERETRQAMSYRRYDYVIRSVTTATVALMIVAVCCFEVIRDGDVHGWLAGIGAAVVGYYFGAHYATNGAGLPRLPRQADVVRAHNGSQS